MIVYIHTYYTGKFNSVKHVRVYEDTNEAFAQKEVLGGKIQICQVVSEYK